MHDADPAWEQIKREWNSACAQAARTARLELTNELNQCLRRLRQYQTEGEWVSAILDAASPFADQLAVFELNNGVFRLRGQQQLNLPEEMTFPATGAGAFAGAVASQDPVIALRTAAEVTDALSVTEAGARAYLFPIVNGKRVVAVLFAGGPQVDLNALEMISGIASVVLERRSNSTLHAQIALSGPRADTEEHGNKTVSPPPKSNGVTPLSWTQLNETQRSVHIRAQRFSRVSVAEMQLFRPEACRAGREQGNLYLFLQQEIDTARETYRKQFMTTPTMVDYLHLELVRTAAHGDELKLGAEYPGQLV